MRTMTVAVILLACLGCAGSAEPEATAEPTIYVVRGVFDQVESDGSSMIVQHEEISGYMAAMTMPNNLEDPNAAAALEYGDKIEFRLVVTGHDAVAREIRRLPEDTELQLVP